MAHGSAKQPGRTAGGRPPTRCILRGDLDRIGLAALLTMLDMERLSGMLIVQQKRQLGRLWMKGGQLFRARTEGARRLSGTDAVYQMLGWREGQFELWQALVDGRDEIGTPTTVLLMEGLRRMDEQDRPATPPGLLPTAEPVRPDLDMGQDHF